MARLPYLEKEDLPPGDRDVLSRDIALMRALAHSPDAARAMSGLGSFIRHRSRLDPRLRELAILQVGYSEKVAYEWAHHLKIGFEAGVSERDVAALIDETHGRTSALEPLARMVLRAAREMTRDLAIGEATFSYLSDHLGAELIVDLTVTIAFYCAVVRVLATLEIDLEADYQEILKRYPLRGGTR
ncbi:MAG: carboxymuconolactone decarboxylase family protein [Candidatus Binatia bacterium]